MTSLKYVITVCSVYSSLGHNPRIHVIFSDPSIAAILFSQKMHKEAKN